MTEYALVEGSYGSNPLGSEGNRQIKVKPSSREKIESAFNSYVDEKKATVTPVAPTDSVGNVVLDNIMPIGVSRQIIKEATRPIKLPQEMAKNTMTNALQIAGSVPAVEIKENPVAAPVVSEYKYEPVAEAPVVDAVGDIPAAEVTTPEKIELEVEDIKPIVDTEATMEFAPVVDTVPVVVDDSPKEEPVVDARLVEDVQTVPAVASTEPELSFEGILNGQYADNETAYDSNDVMFKVEPTSAQTYEEIERKIAEQESTGTTPTFVEPVVADEEDASLYMDAVDQEIENTRMRIPRGGSIARVEPYTPKIGFDDHGNLIGAGEEYDTATNDYAVAKIVSTYSPEGESLDDKTSQFTIQRDMPIIAEDDHVGTSPVVQESVTTVIMPDLERLRELRNKAVKLREKQGQVDDRVKAASSRANEASQRAEAAKLDFDKELSAAIERETATISELEDSIRMGEGEALRFENSADEFEAQADMYVDQAQAVRMGRI